jgi:hypothetical protein
MRNHRDRIAGLEEGRATDRENFLGLGKECDDIQQELANPKDDLDTCSNNLAAKTDGSQRLVGPAPVSAPAQAHEDDAGQDRKLGEHPAPVSAPAQVREDGTGQDCKLREHPAPSSEPEPKARFIPEQLTGTNAEVAKQLDRRGSTDETTQPSEKMKEVRTDKKVDVKEQDNGGQGKPSNVPGDESENEEEANINGGSVGNVGEGVGDEDPSSSTRPTKKRRRKKKKSSQATQKIEEAANEGTANEEAANEERSAKEEKAKEEGMGTQMNICKSILSCLLAR